MGHFQIGRGAGCILDNGVDELRRAMCVSSPQLQGVDKLIAQFRILFFNKGSEEIVSSIFQPAPQDQRKYTCRQHAPKHNGQAEPPEPLRLNPVIDRHDGE